MMADRGPEAFSTVIIDGYNLLHRVPVLSSRLAASGLEAARSYLLGWLRRYQEVRRRRVMLVLDAPRASRSDFGPVEVHYSPDADSAVVGLAGPRTLVVSSDLAVSSGAAACGATVLSSEDFWRAMTANASPGRRRDAVGQPCGRDPRARPKKLTKRERRRRREHEQLLRRV